MAERVLETSLRPNFVLATDSNAESSFDLINSQLLASDQKKRVEKTAKHSKSAIFSKFAEPRLHPELVPGQNPKHTLIKTPGPGVYDISNNDNKQTNSSACFKAQMRPLADDQALVDNYPGPGYYEHIQPESCDKQAALSSHFSKAVGRDLFCSKEKLKLFIDKNATAIPSSPASKDHKNLGPGTYFNKDRVTTQRNQQQLYAARLFRQ